MYSFHENIFTSKRVAEKNFANSVCLKCLRQIVWKLNLEGLIVLNLVDLKHFLKSSVRKTRLEPETLPEENFKRLSVWTTSVYFHCFRL